MGESTYVVDTIARNTALDCKCDDTRFKTWLTADVWAFRTELLVTFHYPTVHVRRPRRVREFGQAIELAFLEHLRDPAPGQPHVLREYAIYTRVEHGTRGRYKATVMMRDHNVECLTENFVESWLAGHVSETSREYYERHYGMDTTISALAVCA